MVNARLSESLQDEERRFGRQARCLQQGKALSEPLRLVKDVLAIGLSMKGGVELALLPVQPRDRRANKDSEATRRAARAAGKGVLGFWVQALVLSLPTHNP